MNNNGAAERLLYALYHQMEAWNLLDWEPDLTARLLALLLSAQSKPCSEATEGMLRRLHWLHLDTALSIVQKH
jgi:type VI secretion system protein VasJ